MQSFAFLASLTLASAGSMSEFTGWMSHYGKTYNTPEEVQSRFETYLENTVRVARQNAAHIASGGDAIFGTTGPFMDISEEEFKAIYLSSYKPSNTNVTKVTPTFDGPIANDIDWRNNGACTPVKNQGQCGSCWAFSATQGIESYGFLNGGYKLLVLAPQQITSCDTTSYGCQGGWTEHAYNYVVGAGGIEAESQYPYTSGTFGVTGSCKANSAYFVSKIKGYTAVSAGESNLAVALNSGPPSICLCAESFQTYTGGIMTSCCTQVDHCVQAVGYTSNYWIVKNSWGTSWGEQGFIRIARGSDLCKISDDVNYPNF
jgi:hypothetical protein